jgi:hypothetical protein
MGVTLALILALALPPSALAWRQPTPSERRAITQAAEHASHEGRGKIYVSKIRVSTVGPWASAELTKYEPGPNRATDALHKVHGKWTNARVGSLGAVCVMPAADQQNLFGIRCKGVGRR